MPKTHRAYEPAFRQQAVDLLLQSGRPLDTVAAELGVSANTLRTWLSAPPRSAVCTAKMSTSAASAKS